MNAIHVSDLVDIDVGNEAVGAICYCVLAGVHVVEQLCHNVWVDLLQFYDTFDAFLSSLLVLSYRAKELAFYLETTFYACRTKEV